MSHATHLYAYLRAAGLDDSLRLHGLVPERPGESDFDGKTPKGKTMDHDQGMSMHEHGTRFVDDAGRCLACCLNVKDAAIAQLSRDLDAALAENARLKAEAIGTYPINARLCDRFVNGQGTRVEMEHEMRRVRASVPLSSPPQAAGGAT